MFLVFALHHCKKNVQIRSFFWLVYSCIRTVYGDLLVNLCIQSESGKIRTRKNSVFGHFSRSGCVLGSCSACVIRKFRRSQRFYIKIGSKDFGKFSRQNWCSPILIKLQNESLFLYSYSTPTRVHF